jgi:flagellar FliL protein
LAADEENTTMETPEGGESSEGEQAAVTGGKKKLIVFGGIGVAAVVVGLAVALFVIKPMMSNSDGAETDQTEVTASSHGEVEKPKPKPKPKPAKKHASDEEGVEGTSLIYAVQDIVVNPAGTGGSRFLSVSFGFELESAALEAEFKAREPLVRDALITILSAKSVAQLTDPKQKEIVRYQIKKRVSQLMETNELTAVYYTDFVLQ